MKLSVLVGNGRKIGLLILPFLMVGIPLNILFPGFFAVGGPGQALTLASILVLALGTIIWAWSVVLILTKIPRKQLITTGPYRVAKHPLYNGVAILVLPWVGFLLNTWIGAVFGAVVLIGSLIFAKEEEAILAKIYGDQWFAYARKVLIKWL